MRSARQIYAGYRGYSVESLNDGFSEWGRPWVVHHSTQEELILMVQAGLNESNSHLAARDARIAQLEAENASLRTNLQQSGSQITTKNTRISQLSAENASLASQPARWQAEINQVRWQASMDQASATSNLHTKIMQLEIRNKDLQEYGSKKAKEANDLQKKLLESQKSLNVCNTTIANLQSEIEKLKNELSQLKDKAESKLAGVQAKIGLFKQIIATSSGVDSSVQPETAISVSNAQ